jgi:hypothetical protein
MYAFTHSKFCLPNPSLFGATPAINNDRSLNKFISMSGTSEDTDADASGVDSNNIPITEEEHDALVKYTPQENEWPDESYDTAVERLTRGLSLISELPFAGPFAYPVDVRAYPDYWSVVAYPMDLKAIIDRLGNKYYRYYGAVITRDGSSMIW